MAFVPWETRPSAVGCSLPGPPHPWPAVGGLFNDSVSLNIRLWLNQNVFHACEVRQTNSRGTGPNFSPGCKLGEVRARHTVSTNTGSTRITMTILTLLLRRDCHHLLSASQRISIRSPILQMVKLRLKPELPAQCSIGRKVNPGPSHKPVLLATS